MIDYIVYLIVLNWMHCCCFTLFILNHCLFLYLQFISNVNYILFNSSHHVKPPVRLHGPTFLFTECNLLQEVIASLILHLILLQRCTQVTHVMWHAELRNPSEQHERKKRDKQTRLRAQGEISIDTGVLEERTKGKFSLQLTRSQKVLMHIFAFLKLLIVWLIA